MYEESINKITDIFSDIVIDDSTGKKLEVYPYPLDEGSTPDSYPALIIYPDDYNNELASTNANRKALRYRAVLMIKAEGIDNETLYLHTLPRTADMIIEEIDKEWDGEFFEGSSRRVWIWTDVGTFGAEETNDGKIAFLNMQINVEFHNDY